MKKRLSNLLSVKSLVTITLTGVFSYLSIIQKISPQEFVMIFTTIIGFYFGTQNKKKDGEDDGGK